MRLRNRCTIDSRIANQYISTSNYSAKELFEDRRAFRATQSPHDLSVLLHRYSGQRDYEPEQEPAPAPKKPRRK